MWFVLAIIAILCAGLVVVVRLALAGRPTPDENDPHRQHQVTDPTHPHPDPGVSNHPTGPEHG